MEYDHPSSFLTLERSDIFVSISEGENNEV